MLSSIAALFVRPVVRGWWPTTRAGWRRQRPHDTQAHSGGVNADRILLMGNGAAVGFGVLTQDLALSGRLATEVSARTGRAADIEVVAHTLMTAPRCREALLDIRLYRYDAVVITLGMNEALTLKSPGRWERELDELCAAIEAEGVGGLQVILVGVPEIESVTDIPRVFAWFASRHARLLNARTRQVAAHRPSVTYVPFSPDDSEGERYGSKASYADWARLIAPALVSRLTGGAENRVFTAQNEHDRQGALDELHILDTAPDARFDSITASARNLFGTAGAAITFIDRERLWVKSAVGISPRDTPRITAFCNTTIRRPDLFVVGDTEAQPEYFTDRPTTYAPYDRFYAGYPIESPDGQRIGALCVIDHKPRAFTAADATLLRELAQQVQVVLWTDEHGPQIPLLAS